MSKYRKRPVVVEAREFTSGVGSDLAEWCGGFYDDNGDGRGGWIEIKTLEGAMRANLGDWIIQGVKGEFYPCKPDIFYATYELSQSEVRSPEIVCLTGSTRFMDAYDEAMKRLSLEGKIVLTVAFPTSHENSVVTPEQKKELDELHFRKIDLADSVLVLNVGGYIGPSTGMEITYAELHGKSVRYLEPPLKAEDE